MVLWLFTNLIVTNSGLILSREEYIKCALSLTVILHVYVCAYALCIVRKQ